jgi:RNA methyltransferase, RsmD family
MRIITGDYKGRKLETPVGYDIRPTTDKVKEAIFNLLMNDIYGKVCCDLFAGTGSLGLEALSRGASRCYFGDSARTSINLVKLNVKKCNAEEKSIIIPGDYQKVLGRINEKVDVYFLDPPYRAGLYEKCLSQIDSLDLLGSQGIILAEHGARDIMPENVGRLMKVKERKYGKTMVSIYKNAEDINNDENAEEY